jgi:hypothetical protein
MGEIFSDLIAKKPEPLVYLLYYMSIENPVNNYLFLFASAAGKIRNNTIPSLSVVQMCKFL